MNKLKTLMLAIPFALMPLTSQAQEKPRTNSKNNLQIEQIQENQWNTWFGTSAIYPHDEDLKNAFKSYFGLTGETQKKVGKDLFLGVNGTIGWGNSENNEYKINATLSEMSGLLIYKLGTKKSQFSIGAGPKISLLNLTAKEKTNSGYINLDSDKYSGIGYTLRMKYSTKISKKVSLFAKFGYSKIDNSDEYGFDLGTTSISMGLEF
ncbi:outer membrane beta-barrel protein [archaeon]|jgi:hypothetical protein|nr:outer membrane beta-barrel protein [archaeon]